MYRAFGGIVGRGGLFNSKTNTKNSRGLGHAHCGFKSGTDQDVIDQDV